MSRVSSARRWSDSGTAVELVEGLDTACDVADKAVGGGAPAEGKKSCGLGFELVVWKGEMMGGLKGSEGEGWRNDSKRSNEEAEAGGMIGSGSIASRSGIVSSVGSKEGCTSWS